MTKPKNPTVAYWFPALFCAVLSAFVLVLGLESAKPAFFCFLPMCFVFTAAGLQALHQKSAVLEARIAELSARLQHGARPPEP